MALAAALLLASCRFGESPAEDAPAPANESSNVGAGMLPTPQPPLNRERLLLAMVQARSAAAAGTDDREAQSALDGQRFEFRIRLGCTIGEPDAGATGTRVTVDPETRQVELFAQPDVSLEQPPVASVAQGGFEAAEGFWIEHPWLLQSACPAASPPAAVPAEQGPEEGQAPSEQKETDSKASASPPKPVPLEPPAERAASVQQRSVALVQFFEASGSRLERRDGRPYSARDKLPEGAPAPPPGRWELVIVGRLRALQDRVIHCSLPEPGAIPTCIIAAEFERVAIRNAETGTELARWARE